MGQSFYLSRGARYILEGNAGSNHRYAFIYASFAFYFAQHIVTHLLKTQAAIDWLNVTKLLDSDDLTLLRFFRESIPCSCLNEKYEEAKSSLVKLEEEEEEPEEIWNYHRGLKSIVAMQKEQELVEFIFETDQLSQCIA